MRKRGTGGEGLFGRLLGISVLLNLGAGAALTLTDVPLGRMDEGPDGFPVQVVTFETDVPLADVVEAPESSPPPAPSPGPAAPSRPEAARPEAAAPPDRAEGGRAADEAAAAFLAAFGTPAAGGSGPSLETVAGRAGSARSAPSPSPSTPTADVDVARARRLGHTPLGGDGSGVASRLGSGAGGGDARVERSAATRVAVPDAPDRTPARERAAETPDEAAGSADAFERVGREVRRRESQIRFCYEERGLKANPALGGTLRVEFQVTDGRVTEARVRSGLSGAGSDETEACVLQAIRGWRFQDVPGTVTVPFTFVLSR